MDNRADKDSSREEDQRGVDLLADRLEFYRLISIVCFRRLSKEEKIDALIEVASLIREQKGEKDE